MTSARRGDHRLRARASAHQEIPALTHAETALVRLTRLAYDEESKSWLIVWRRYAMHSRTVRSVWRLLWLSCALSACGGLPLVQRTESRAIPPATDTTLGKAAAAQLRPHPGMTGAALLEDGVDAFGARVGLARAAGRTLDVQYYIFHADNSGHAMLGELLAAADRGVRVRLLLDDIHTGELDEILATIATHPNFQVRLFNPFIHRRARLLDAISDFRRISRRMHNKSFTADNAAAIVGGRNIGGEYFGAKPDLDFSDLDLLIIGAAVNDVSAEFDLYWNSRQAYPVGALLHGKRAGADSLQALRARIAQHVQAMYGAVDGVDPGNNELAQAIAAGRLPPFFWDSALVIADPPDKVVQPPQESDTHAVSRLVGLLEQARRELILVSPYFVPGKQGVRWLQGLVRRGVRVQVITNSYAATDVRAVHAGYMKYREQLLRAGIQLYEMKPSAHTVLARQTRRRSVTGPSRSSLHAKAYMTDGRSAYVGSFNLDHRSARLNTEMGVVVNSERLCAKLHADFISMILDVAYRVELVDDARGGTPRLAWITREENRELRYDSEPGVGPLQSIYMGLLRMLPIEDQL
jgi:putative cardiolipin synthase